MQLGELIYVPAQTQPVLELVTMYFAYIDPKLCGKIVVEINSVAPLAEMHHAKRVRKCTANPSRVELLLCKASDSTSSCVDNDTYVINQSCVQLSDSNISQQLPPPLLSLLQQYEIEQIYPVQVVIKILR